MIERVRGARARDEDGSPEPRLAPPGHFDQAGEIPLATRLSSGVDGARLVRGPEALAATPSAGVLSILSDAIRDTAGTYLVTGATVGAGAHLRFTVTFAAGTTASAASTLLFSNGAVAYLATGAGATVGTYILEVTADTAATSALTVAGIDLGTGAGPQAATAATGIAIDPTRQSPSDLLYAAEWYANGTYGTHADAVWGDYTGKGVTVAVFDNGIEYSHPDLAGNLDVSLGYNPYYDTRNGTTDTRNGDSTYELDSSGNDHGTTVAGLIAAGRNGSGTVGVAYDATLYSIFHYYGSSTPADVPYDGTVNAYLDAAAHADVMNNSWGTGSAFFDSERDAAVRDAMAFAATEGRGGLGTVLVHAAGNDGAYNWDSNASYYANSRFNIVVGASAESGRQYTFSTRGASVLVSAPGGSEVSTDRAGANGYNVDPSGGLYTDTPASYFSGTSGATPVTSGVVALMLEANAKLGARDVQEILAYSAQPSQSGALPYLFNGASNWNNGGLRYNNAVGLGIVDARAAVRLAETWNTQRTWGNVVEQSAAIAPNDIATVSAGTATTITRTIHLDTQQTIDRVDLKLDIATTHPEFLTITLTSPDGSKSVLLNRLGDAGSNYVYWNPDQDAGVHWTFDSTQFMGELAAGDWTLTVTTAASGTTQYVPNADGTDWVAIPITYPITTTLQSAELTVYGDAVDPNTTYFYTDAYARAFHGTTLTDADGGYDTINAAAVSGTVVVSLDPGFGGSSIGGRELVIDDTHVWRVFGGDAHDEMIGSSTNPTALYGMRGDDGLIGGAATTLLVGGTGDDMLYGSGRAFTVAGFAGSVAAYTLGLSNGAWTIANADQGSDTCVNVAWAWFDDGVFALGDDGTTTRLTGVVCDLSLDPALGLGLAETGAGFLAYSGALAAYAGELASLVLTDTAALTLDVAQLLGAAPLLDLIDNVAFSLADTAATIGAAIDDLAPLADDLTTVTVTDAQTIHIAQADYDASIEIVSRITGDYTLAVALDDGGTQLFARRGVISTMTMLDAEGHKTSVTTVDPGQNHENVVRTYSGGRIVTAEFNGVFDRPYNHLVRQYENGHLVLEKRDGFSGGDVTMRLAAYDENGTLRTLTSAFTGRDYQTLSLGYDADGHLATRTRDGFDGPVSSITGFYDADGTAYATRTVLDDGTSRLVGSASGNALSLALADTIRGRAGPDTFTVSADDTNGAILDFNRAAGDRIDLSQLFGSADDAHFIKDAGFGGHAGEIRFEHVDGGVLVQIDLDGDALADTSFAVNGARVLATDFVF